ncbi:MAG: hypothetical protein Q9188_001432 [Gyalolechia gomerana]
MGGFGSGQSEVSATFSPSLQLVSAAKTSPGGSPWAASAQVKVGFPANIIQLSSQRPPDKGFPWAASAQVKVGFSSTSNETTLQGWVSLTGDRLATIQVKG